MSALSAAVEKCLSQMSLSSLQIWRVRSLHLEKPKRILRPTAVDAIGVCARSTARLTHTHLTPLHASHVQLADIAAFPVAANFNRTTVPPLPLSEAGDARHVRLQAGQALGHARLAARKGELL